VLKRDVKLQPTNLVPILISCRWFKTAACVGMQSPADISATPFVDFVGYMLTLKLVLKSSSSPA